MTHWHDYQRETAEFFQGLGLEATIDETLQGIRTTHDVDVVVRSVNVGFEAIWLVECKHWRTPVTKLHVLALREIVNEVGADRGFIVGESGFQSGAYEASTMTNVSLTSLSELRETVGNEVALVRLRQLQERLIALQERYWAMGKEARIELGLRPDVGQAGYSMTRHMDAIGYGLEQGLLGRFPTDPDPLHNALGTAIVADGPQDLMSKIEAALADAERRMSLAEVAAPSRAQGEP